MLHFTVDADTAVDASCQKCCCERINLKPGTTTKVSVGYAPWAVPIGQLHCTPQFMIEPMQTCLMPTPSNIPPASLTGSDIVLATPVNAAMTDSLASHIIDPEGLPLSFKALPFYTTKHGKLQLAEDGMFTYTPISNYKGPDSFFVTASDGPNQTVFEIMIAVGIPTSQVMPTPKISVGVATVDQRYFTVSFPVTLSPAVQDCEMWKLTVMQAALDCACDCYTRTDCFDIGVAGC